MKQSTHPFTDTANLGPVVTVPTIFGESELPTLDDAWDGIMLTYTEQDFPTSKPYARQIPGWQCRACGQKYGTSGLPPNPCKCGAAWSKTVSVG